MQLLGCWPLKTESEMLLSHKVSAWQSEVPLAQEVRNLIIRVGLGLRSVLPFRIFGSSDCWIGTQLQYATKWSSTNEQTTVGPILWLHRIVDPSYLSRSDDGPSFCASLVWHPEICTRRSCFKFNKQVFFLWCLYCQRYPLLKSAATHCFMVSKRRT